MLSRILLGDQYIIPSLYLLYLVLEEALLNITQPYLNRHQRRQKKNQPHFVLFFIKKRGRGEASVVTKQYTGNRPDMNLFDCIISTKRTVQPVDNVGFLYLSF